MALHEFNYEKEATVSIVKSILTDAIKMKASDIHFDPEPSKLLIRFRINGDLIEYTTTPENVKTNIITRIKILSGMNITEATIPQMGSINFELSSQTHNMRTASIPVVDGEKIVVHLSNYAKNFKNLNSLGFERENVKKILDMLNDQDGIILITGINSSGKTTTLYSILQELSKKPLNIISVENPIKMKLPGVNQVQINNEKGITYNSILKSILLSDPDVIAINELINDETIRTALRASISGRLVVSTMHTKTAFTTIKSLLKMDVENYLLGSNLNGIISQRLVKKLCPTCREVKQTSEYEKKIIKEILGKDIDEIYVPCGCEECQDGYIEQIPVVEVVKINDELRQAISNHRNEDLIYDIIYSENDSIIKDVFKKVINGDTSFEEAIKIIDIKTDINPKDTKLKNLILGNLDEDEITEETKEEEIQEEKPIEDKKRKRNKKEKNDEESIIDDTKTKVDDEETTKEETSKEETDSTSNDEDIEENNKEEQKEEPQEEKPTEDKQDDAPKEPEEQNILSDSELLKKALKIIENQLKTKDNEQVPLSSSPENNNVEPKEDNLSVEKIVPDPIPQPETTNENQIPTPSEAPQTIIIPNDDDNDDDDDDTFNYGNSYINNF